MPPSATHLTALIGELRRQPQETPWLEFKENQADPQAIGEYLSALSNAAALHGRPCGYVIWGVRDGTHDLTGTSFHPAKKKKGSEDLESWLVRLLSPRLHFQFHELTIGGHRVVLLEIPAAESRPVQFHGVEFIRVGSHRQKLKDHPQLERALWQRFDTTPFEQRIAFQHADAAAVLSLLDTTAALELLNYPAPEDRTGVLQRLESERLITSDGAGAWHITCLGAALFARNLEDFGPLGRKAVRIIVYEGQGRTRSLREQILRRGYAAGFEEMIRMVNALLPRSEVIGQALRQEVPLYPEPAVRELVANALIHQDFAVTGAGPTVEIFTGRLEITNPGAPLVSTQRFLDSPPLSRNEALASLMRRASICEERGSGVDKVVAETEKHLLPAPLFETPGDFTRAVLFTRRPLREMTRADRSRACYLHACLRHIERDTMTNSSLRLRLGIIEENASMISRIIRDAIHDGLVKPLDPNQARKSARYLPFWA